MAHHHDDNHHGHTHGMVDPSIATTTEGLWALKWSFVVLMATALLQAAVVFVSGSVGLLADTIHNFGDAATAVPLGIAFLFARKRPTKQFTFGYGRVEDLAGMAIVFTIFSARSLPATRASIDLVILKKYRIWQRLPPHPRSVLWAMKRSRFSASASDGGSAVPRLSRMAIMRGSTAGPVWRCLSVC